MAHPPASASSWRTAAPPFSPASNRPGTGTAATARPLSAQDADEIDGWLARLRRLEGARPCKESLPARPAAALCSASTCSSSTTAYTAASIGIASSSIQSCRIRTSEHTAASTSKHPHTRRRSLAFFGIGGGSGSHSDHIPRSATSLSLQDQQIADTQPNRSPPAPLPRASPGEPASPRLNPPVDPAARAPVPALARLTRTATFVPPAGHRQDKAKQGSVGLHATECHQPDGICILLTETGASRASESDWVRIQASPELPLPLEQQKSGHTAAPTGYSTPYLYTHLKLDERHAGDVSGPAAITSDRHVRPSPDAADTPYSPHPIQGQTALNRDMASQLSEAFSPTATLSSARSAKSVSTASSSNTPSSCGDAAVAGSGIGIRKLQPRSPFSSPKATMSSRSGKKHFPLHGVDTDSDNSSETDVHDSGYKPDTSTKHRESNHQRGENSSSGPGPVSRAKKLSKGSFTSSMGSVRESIAEPPSTPSSSKDDKHGRRGSSDSRVFSVSHSSPRSGFFNRNSSKHPHSPSMLSQQAELPSHVHQQNEAPSFRPPRTKLVAREERFYSSKERSRPRLTSARSASSLQLGGSANHNQDSERQAYNGLEIDNEEDEQMFNPRRASISSTSPSHQRSKDDRRAILAASNHRISLAVPPPLIRSYSYDGRMTVASLAASSSFIQGSMAALAGSESGQPSPSSSFNAADLARHIPDMKQTVLLWTPVNDHTGATTSYQSSFYAGATKASSSTSHHYSHNRSNHHLYHHQPPSAAKGLANALLSNVPIVNSRKRMVRRESTQLVLSDDLIEQGGENDHHVSEQKHHYHVDEKKEKERKKHHQHNEKGKGRASILLPIGQWKKGEAVLKSNGSLVISSGAICLASVQLSSLRRTDIRPVDPSVLGRQRCISLHIKNGPYIPPPAYSPAHDKRTSPGCPTSPSAPDFFSFAPLTSTSSVTRSTSNCGVLQDALHVRERGQTLVLAFPSTALQHAWIASMLCHAQPEVWPRGAAVDTAVKPTPCEEDVVNPTPGDEDVSSQASEDDEEEDSVLRRSPAPRPKYTQHSSWRQALQEDPSTQYPIRMYRSVSLQIIQARCSKEHQNPSLSQSLAALAMHSLPSTPTSPDMIHIQKRTGSIASVVTTETASSSEAHSHIDGPNGAMPSHLKLALLAQQQQYASSSMPTFVSSGKKTDSYTSKESKKEESMDLFCEIWLDGEILGRTGIRHLGTKTIWEETFHFSNLGLYKHSLDIHVFTIRKHQVQLAGKVSLPLPTMQRNKPIEGWFELQPLEHVLKKGHLECLGEMNLRVLVKEDTALPYKAYSELGSIIAQDVKSAAILRLLDDCYIELDLFAQLLLRIDTAHRRVLQRIMSLCEKEVDSNDNIATLFRGNTLLTKTVELHMRSVGSDYLDNTIGQVLRNLCEESVLVEIDPSRLDNRENLQDHIRALEKWCDAIWTSIYNSRHSCPIEIRRSLRKIRQIVDVHCAEEQDRGCLSEEERSKARITSVSAFISLRFFCPAILRPNLFRLCPNHPPDAQTSRTLTLIAKVLMGMANMQTFGSKEPWMAAMNPFLRNNTSSYQDFITFLCSKEERAKSDWTEKDFDPYKIPILKRMTLTPDIVKEGVPELPFLVDLPKEYSALAALVATAEPTRSQSESSQAIQEDYQVEQPLHQTLLDMCRTLHRQSRSRVRALVRTGELAAPGSERTHRMLARTEQVRLPVRMRGSTFSKAMSTPSPDKDPMLSKFSSAGSTDESRAEILASSPGSTTSGCVVEPLSNLSASTSSSMNTSSESQRSSSPTRPKRRSYTVSASTSLLKNIASPSLASSMLSRPAYVPPVQEDDDMYAILNIRNPSSSSSPPAQPVMKASPRRSTIIAPRPLVLDAATQVSPPSASAKTPRAPTFTQEQRENLRELQDALNMSALDNSDPAFSVAPEHGNEPPLSPSAVVSPPKRKLFRKK